MKTLSRIVVVLSVAALVGSVRVSAQGQASGVDQQLIKLDQQLAQAQSRGDADAVARILADDYVFTDQTGRMGTKKEAVANAREAGPDKGSIENSDYKVVLHGETAVMTHLSAVRGEGGMTEYLRSMHVWVRRGDNWQMAAHQWTPVAVPSRPSRPLINAKCAELSYEPEVFQFYGDSNSILRKLEDDRMGLPHRRAYLLLIETSAGAELAVFERASFEEPTIKVASWRGATLGDLREELTNTILTNRGILCMGEQSVRVVRARYSPRPLGEVSLPGTAKEAFGHFIKKYGTEYMRVTALLLC